MREEKEDRKRGSPGGLLRRYPPALRLGLAGLAAAAAATAWAASRLSYFPGDVPLARAVQSFLPLPEGLALWITASAASPWCFVLLALAVAAAWVIAGRRAAAVALPVFFCSWILGLWLSPVIAQPRPSAELIRVVGQPLGYAFPSIFGLVYMATFGYVGILAAAQGRGPARWVLPAAAALALAIGAIARITLGAHWPSDLWGAWLLGLFWITAFLPLARRPDVTRGRY